MRVLMTMKWNGVTPDQYEMVRKSVNWEGDLPKGAVFHAAGFHDGALRVTDIWESAEDFNNFVSSRLMPGVAQTGITGQPEVEVFPVHAVFAPVAL